MPRNPRPRRHWRVARGMVACGTFPGADNRGWQRAPLRSTRDPDRVTCLRCLPAMDRPTRDNGARAVELPAQWHARAMECAASDFQRGILQGSDSLSGSTRDGFWRYRRREQLITLLERFTRNGIPWRIERRGKSHKQVLVIGGGNGNDRG